MCLCGDRSIRDDSLLSYLCIHKRNKKVHPKAYIQIGGSRNTCTLGGGVKWDSCQFTGRNAARGIQTSAQSQASTRINYRRDRPENGVHLLNGFLTSQGDPRRYNSSGGASRGSRLCHVNLYEIQFPMRPGCWCGVWRYRIQHNTRWYDNDSTGNQGNTIAVQENPSDKLISPYNSETSALNDGTLAVNWHWSGWAMTGAKR